MPFGFETKEEFENAVAAISSQQVRQVETKLKQFKKETVDEIQTRVLGEFGKTLEGKFQSLETIISGKRDKKSAGKPGEAGGSDEEPDANPHMRTLQKQIEELQAKNKHAEEKASAAENRRRMMTVRSRLREVLEQNGVTNPHKVKGAMAILIDQEKRVDFSESFDDAAVIDTDGAPIDLEQGVRTWLSTEEGEYYKDPSGAAGAGTRPHRGQQNGAPQPLTKEQLGQAMLASWNRSGG